MARSPLQTCRSVLEVELREYILNTTICLIVMIFNRLYILLYLIVILSFRMLCLELTGRAKYSSFGHSFDHKLGNAVYVCKTENIVQSVCFFFVYKILENVLTVSLRNKIKEPKTDARQADNIVLDFGRPKEHKKRVS